jgi:acyl-CoA synthetase (AMP-forming)/AMP-acid ligase II
VGVRVHDDKGRPLAAGEIGGIEVKGPNVFKGYWRMPEKTADEFTTDLWFKTGDVGRIDADGYVTIVGRSKDLIISGGYNVYPAEIEGVINEMPGVAESAVVGVPHPDFGEAVVAVVVPKPGARRPAAHDRALKARIANFKVPKRSSSSPSCRATRWARCRRTCCATSLALMVTLSMLTSVHLIADKAWTEAQELTLAAEPGAGQVVVIETRRTTRS